jgi:hypothetical protein
MAGVSSVPTCSRPARDPPGAACRHHPEPDRCLTTQTARNFTMDHERTIRFLIRDGAGQVVTAFDDLFRSDDTSIIRTPPDTQ